jgi:serine/threonine-protein kinase
MQRSRRVGRYHLLDRVACGGMAEVYRAKVFSRDGDTTLVALKKVLDMYADDPYFVKMLIAEYHLSALLKHPNIAAIYELLRSPDGYFIAMEFVDGKDLRATMARAHDDHRRFEVADSVYLMARALDGLHCAHTATTDDGQPLNLVHRDFSPSNILIGYDGSVKIIDFGIAKAAVPRDRTATGIIKGKVRYMSPEQANGDERLTGQSDVFSAGSVLYELLCDEPAFNAPNELELIYTVRRAQPKPLQQIAPHVPEGLVDIVKRAMARSKRDRFGSAAEFRDALVTFLRAYAPGYRRTRLANLMRTLWAREIDEEIRTLLSFAVSEQDEGSEAENLLDTASVDESIQRASQFVALTELQEVASEDAPESKSPASKSLPPVPRPRPAAGQPAVPRPRSSTSVPPAPPRPRFASESGMPINPPASEKRPAWPSDEHPASIVDEFEVPTVANRKKKKNG